MKEKWRGYVEDIIQNKCKYL